MLTKILPPLLILAPVFVCYSETFHYPFHFDEEPFFTRGDPAERLKDIKTIWEFNPERFLNFLSFGVNYWIGGVDTFGYHIVNFVIHALNGFIVLWFAGMALSKIGKRDNAVWRLYPLFVALVFVSHPIQTQAVTYLWQRATSLSSLFYLLSLALYAKSRLMDERGEGKKAAYSYLAVSLLSGLAAMFTKQISVTLPVAVFLVELCFFSGSLAAARKNAPRMALFLPLLLIIPVLSALGMGREMSDIGSRSANVLSHKDYLLTQFNVIVTYLRLIFYPAGQNLDYDYPAARTFADSSLSFFLLIGILAGGVFLWRINRIITFGVLFFFLALSVESSIFPLEDVIFEHRVYLPSVGLIMAVGAIFFTGAEKLDTRWEAEKTLFTMAVIMVAAVAVLTVTTRARNEVWRDKETLWKDVVAKSPNKLRGYFHLGMYYTEHGEPEEAEGWYRKALKVNPASDFAHFKLGRLYEKKGDMDSAITEYTLAWKGNPNLALAPLAIGNVYMKKGEPHRARGYYEAALKISPQLVEAKDGLAKAVEAGGGEASPRSAAEGTGN